MAHSFQKGVADFAPGVLWLVRSRVDMHKRRYGGRLPQRIVLHNATFVRFIEEAHKEGGVPLEDMPIPMHAINGFEGPAVPGVVIMRCRCAEPLAADLLFNCEGQTEEL